MEIVVSEKYVSKVLTDEANFSFEQGVADVGAVIRLRHLISLLISPWITRLWICNFLWMQQVARFSKSWLKWQINFCQSAWMLSCNKVYTIYHKLSKPTLANLPSIFNFLFPSNGTGKDFRWESRGSLSTLPMYSFRCHGCTPFWTGMDGNAMPSFWN